MKPVVVLGFVGAAIAALFFVLFNSPSGTEGDGPGLDQRTPKEVQQAQERTTEISLDRPAKESGRALEAVTSSEREAVGSLTGELIEGAWSNGLQGIITDKNGAPIADVELELVAGATDTQFSILEAVASAQGGKQLPTWHGKTSDEGTFEFTNLPPNQPYRLTASHPDFAEKKKSNFAITETGITQIKVILGRGYTLTGRVLDDLNGDPIEGAEMRLQSIMSMLPGADGRGDQVTHTDQEGRYEFLNVTGGTRNLTVIAEGYGSRTRNNLLFSGPIAEAEPTVQDFRLGPGLALFGRVFAPDMTPIVGAKVEATSYETAQVSRGKAVSDQGGAFAIQGLAEGTFMVIVRAPGFSDQRVTRVQLSDPELQIIMARQGGVMGSVVSGQNGGPVPAFRASVRMVAPGSTTYGRAVASANFNDPSGAFELSGLEAGSYAMQVEAQGFAPTYSETFIVNQGIVTPEVVVTMGQGGAITGRLVDAKTGQPVANADVRTFDNGFVENPFTQMVGNMIPRTTTERKVRSDANGIFTIEAITATTYQIQIKHADYTVEDVKDIIVREGETTDLGTYEMYRGAMIRGKVYDVSGRPLPNARVTLTGNTMYPSSATTDDTGAYVLSNVPAGTWKIAAQRPMTQAENNPFIAIIDIRASEQTLSISDGQEVNRDLTIGN